MSSSERPRPAQDAEITRRREILADTRHSIEMEGGSVPADTRAVQERWARGEITLEQMGAEIDRLYPSMKHR